MEQRWSSVLSFRTKCRRQPQITDSPFLRCLRRGLSHQVPTSQAPTCNQLQPLQSAISEAACLVARCTIQVSSTGIWMEADRAAWEWEKGGAHRQGNPETHQRQSQRRQELVVLQRVCHPNLASYFLRCVRPTCLPYLSPDRLRPLRPLFIDFLLLPPVVHPYYYFATFLRPFQTFPFSFSPSRASQQPHLFHSFHLFPLDLVPFKPQSDHRPYFPSIPSSLALPPHVDLSR